MEKKRFYREGAGETMRRPVYTRDDLEELKTFDRAQVFEVIGSFDDTNLDEDAFVLKAAGLLDPERVAGLTEARKTGDASAVLDLVHKACKAPPPAAIQPDTITDPHKQDPEDALVHRFTFYDETHQLPEDIDWDFNPGTGHWTHDLNRFTYLIPLTRTYQATGDERFSRKAIGLILDWTAKCDFGKAFVGTRYAFGSYLNQALHCHAWAACVRELLPADQVAPIELLRILKSLHEQLAYLEIMTARHLDGRNWPIVGMSGMLGTLAALPVLRDTDRFVRYCVRTLAEQLHDQVLPDGVQNELTASYHYGVIRFFVDALRYAHELGHDFKPHTLDVLRKMVHYCQQTIVPDGSAIAAFNDSDPEAAPDLASKLTAAGLEAYLSPEEGLGPERFPYGGVAFLRQRATDGDLYLAFDGGPYGSSHQHEDKLGFWLHAFGRNFLVDPGRYIYDWSEGSYLFHLQSTRAHSTILIDGVGQHSRGRPETWIATEPVPLNWSVKEGEIRASAAYDLGYGEENAIAVIHRREIVFVNERFWIVFDRVEGEGEHRVEARYQFAPGKLTVDGSRATTGYDHANLLLWALPSVPFDDVHVEEGIERTPRGGWYSPRYGRIEPAPCLSLSTMTALPLFTATLLFPYIGTVCPGISFALDDGAVTVQAEGVREGCVASSPA